MPKERKEDEGEKAIIHAPVDWHPKKKKKKRKEVESLPFYFLLSLFSSFPLSIQLNEGTCRWTME